MLLIILFFMCCAVFVLSFVCHRLILPVSLDCPFLFAPSVVSNVYFRPVSCVPGVASVSGLSICDCPVGFLCRLFNILHSKELHNNFSVELILFWRMLIIFL